MSVDIHMQMVKKHWRIQYPWFKSILSHNNSWLFSSLLYSLWMLMEALCWKLLTRSTFVCGSSHANGPTTLENTVTRSSSFRTRFRPFTPRQPSSNKVIRHCYCYTYPYSRVYIVGLLLSYLVYFLVFLQYCLTLPLLICTWILKNQVGKIKFDELDF